MTPQEKERDLLKDELIRELKITVNWLFKHSPDALKSQRGKDHLEKIFSLTGQVDDKSEQINQSNKK